MDACSCAHILRGIISYHERMNAVKCNALGEGKVCQEDALCPEKEKSDLYLEAMKFALVAVEEKL